VARIEPISEVDDRRARDTRQIEGADANRYEQHLYDAANAQRQEVLPYYGFWLDINQPGDKRFPIMPTPVDGGPFTGPAPLQSIADIIRGVHQCLVAEIVFDPDPIPTGATTADSDKLSQRNLATDHSDNPGSVETHRHQHSFQIRPTAANLPANQRPSELMIRWNGTPRDSI